MRVKRSFIKAVMFLVVFAAMISWSSFSVSAGTEDHKYVVVLDPGHGEKSFGTGEIYNGSYYREHDLVWKIAQYTKKELEKCPYIKVVMTKNSKEELPSLEERVKVAERNVADLLVSFHLNSFTNRNVNGACVLISQGNYRPYLAEQEKLFGSYVMDELMKLGIANYCKRTEGMYYRLASDGSKYINGKTRDYYAIVAGCVEADIPGVIIEHAFLSNYSDFSKFLSTEAKLKKIGVADAKAIKKYIDGLRKKGISNSEDLDSTLTGWVNKYGNCYYYKNGSPVKNKMIKIDGHYYYFDKEGIRYSGWLKYNNKKYYFGPDGKAEDGWLKYDGEWYLFHGTECYMFSNRVYITKEGHVYVFDKEGKRCLREWYTVNGKKYYAGSNGRCLRGHWKLGSQYYYFHLTKGYLYKSIMIKKPGNVRLYAQSNGLLYTGGLKTIGGYTYYFKSNSCSHLGWKKMNGKWYYFDTQTAKMLKNTTMKDSKGKEYKFDANGVCIKGKV